MNQILRKNKYLIITIAGFLFLFVNYANAGPQDYLSYLYPPNLATGLLEFVLSVTGSLLAFVAKLLQLSINFSRANLTSIDAIEVSWRVVRDFVNMLFLLIILIIAFGTIFDTGFGAKYTLGKFLLAALLVNFSLVIGTIIIDSSNIMSAAILETIGNESDVGFRLGQITQPQSVFPDGKSIEKFIEDFSGDIALQYAIGGSTFLALIFTGMALLAYGIAFILAFLRIPMLWFLLIASPMAFAASVLPSTKKYFQQWLSAIFSWSFFLPVYLLFLFLGIYFMNNAAYGSAELLVLQRKVGVETGFINTIANSFGLILNFGLAIAIIGYGAVAAKGISGTLGGLATSWQNRAGGYLKSTLADYTGAGAAWKKFQETGRVGEVQTPYRGAQGRALRQARGRSYWEPDALVKEQANQVNKEKAGLEAKRLTMKDEDFRSELTKIQGDDPRAVAAKMMLSEQGMASYRDETDGQTKTRPITKEDIVGFFEASNGDRTPLGQQFLQNLEKSGALNKLDSREQVTIIKGNDPETSDYLNLRKALGKNIINNNPESALEVVEPVLKTMSPGKEREEWIEQVKWGKVVGKIDSVPRRNNAVTQIKVIQSSNQIDKSDIEKIERKIEEYNPAIIAEAAGKNIKTELGDKLKKDDPKKIGEYLGNVVKSHTKELRDTLIENDPGEINEMVKNSNKETRRALSNLGFEIKRKTTKES